MRNSYLLTQKEWLAFAWRWALWVAVCVGWCLLGYSVIINGSPIAKLLGVVFGVGLGVAGLCLSFPAMKRSVWLNSHGKITEGYVTEVRIRLINTLWPVYVAYYYAYEYVIGDKTYSKDGVYFRFFWRPKIHVGDDVEILIDPHNPKVRKLLRIKLRNI